MRAFVFPGQGSQKVGMGKNHFDSNENFRDTIKKADEIMGISLSEIMFEGPSEDLTQTKFTQPAIFVHSVALFETLGQKPDMVAGHSLGEFSALSASGVLDFETAFKLVVLRGALMQDAGTLYPGTMAAIIGMENEDVEKICKDATEAIQKPVVPANYNSPGQVVISGDVDSVKKAVDLAKESGCRLAKILPVSGAFHSPLMEPAYEALKEKLDEIEFNTPECPVYSNYTATATLDPKVIKENLLQQLVSPVKWTQTIENMATDGAVDFIEVGPGNVLQGLVKRTVKNVNIEGYE
ncbi:MAG: ACP S-malonyltransferase [Balneolaceae bacterium]|nr:ACP S-malonyltransferase [Balneolaceae bacterium]